MSTVRQHQLFLFQTDIALIILIHAKMVAHVYQITLRLPTIGATVRVDIMEIYVTVCNNH